MTQAGSDHYIKQSKLVAILHPKDEKHEAWCRGGDRKFPPVPNQVSQQSHQHQGPSPKIPRKGACHGAVIGVHEFSCHNEEAHNGSPCICNHNNQSEPRKILKRANESSKKKLYEATFQITNRFSFALIGREGDMHLPYQS